MDDIKLKGNLKKIEQITAPDIEVFANSIQVTEVQGGGERLQGAEGGEKEGAEEGEKEGAEEGAEGGEQENKEERCVLGDSSTDQNEHSHENKNSLTVNLDLDLGRKCPHAPSVSSDLSSASSGGDNERRTLRKQRRLKKRRKRQERLKKCCSGCENGNLDPLSPDLPSPIAVSSGMLQCNVIKSFERVVSELRNSEDEIDADIQSYSTVGSRLAHQNGETFSDVELKLNERDECDSSLSDTDILACDYSNSVGKKLANRNIRLEVEADSQHTPIMGKFDDCSAEQLASLVNELTVKLQDINAQLVQEVKEQDDLTGHRTVVLKHIAELTSLVQGKRANDASAFRKIVVSRETDC